MNKYFFGNLKVNGKPKKTGIADDLHHSAQRFFGLTFETKLKEVKNSPSFLGGRNIANLDEWRGRGILDAFEIWK